VGTSEALGANRGRKTTTRKDKARRLTYGCGQTGDGLLTHSMLVRLAYRVG
jgi:hypothetical protein